MVIPGWVAPADPFESGTKVCVLVRRDFVGAAVTVAVSLGSSVGLTVALALRALAGCIVDVVVRASVIVLVGPQAVINKEKITKGRNFSM